MFHSRIIENRISRLHERVLWVVYNDFKNPFFRDLLLKDKSVTINQKIKVLATEIIKAQIRIVSAIISDLFCFPDCLKNETSLTAIKKAVKSWTRDK